ncbi:fimbria/pilus outer membrane usher protein [Kluyvera genomosp. 1]|uniref:fimbria/pilus outer membrane usher protein n=1 Tax=Kluyvera genomosp. 1 TaxID=2774053 RepID=UPI00092D79BA|nr:fimbria/pilus outer membrane usher protein [Kluyvera genomosp. 1]
MSRLLISTPPLILLIIYSSSEVASAREHFNPALLETGQGISANVDLSAYERGSQAPGKYRVDIYLNNKQVDTRDVDFIEQIASADKSNLIPCLSLKQLKEWGVKIDEYPGIATDDSRCANLSAIPAAATELQFSRQRLNISIPQAALLSRPKDYVSPDKWDEGISALLLSYNLSGITTRKRNSSGQDGDSQYGSFHPGLNIGPWRFRNFTTWNHDNTGENNLDSVYNYVSRDIKSLKSQLVLGDSNTKNDVFDSLAFRGASLASDDDMTPDSVRNYAPVIHGIAKSNAVVTVMQNGHSIYKTTVAPGAFEINDLFSTGSAGDLQVEIKESDGSVQTLIVPYASLPVLHREGHYDYSIVAGRTHVGSGKEASFTQSTLIYGLPHGLTLYGGVQYADIDYTALSAGLGENLGNFGALSFDITQAWSKPYRTGMDDTRTQSNDSGQSLRLRYSKDILTTGTNFSIAGYRYSTRGYMSLPDVLQSYDDTNFTGHSKNRTEFTISQDIVYGSIAASYVNEHYWDKSRMSSVSVSYNNSWRGITYGFSYTYNLNNDDNTDSDDVHNTSDSSDERQFSFNLSIPFDSFSSGSFVNYSLNNTRHGATTHNVGISGTALADNSLNWSVQEGYSNDDNQTNGSLYGNYQGRYAELSSGYAYDGNSHRLNYGIQGGIVAHKNGITLAQSLNDTIILVNAQGAKDVPVSSQTGVMTDSRGFAVVPYANPYHKNSISLDTEQITSSNVDLHDTTQYVYPTRGAVVEAGYRASIGYRALFTLIQANGKPVPFGAMVSPTGTPTEKDNSSIVGDEGQAYLSGLQDTGKLQVKWGTTRVTQCVVNYSLPKKKSLSGIEILHAECL